MSSQGSQPDSLSAPLEVTFDGAPEFCRLSEGAPNSPHSRLELSEGAPNSSRNPLERGQTGPTEGEPESLRVPLTAGDGRPSNTMRQGTCRRRSLPQAIRTVRRLRQPATAADLLRVMERRANITFYVEIFVLLCVTALISFSIVTLDGVSDYWVLPVLSVTLAFTHFVIVALNWVMLGFVGGLTKYLWLNISVNTVLLIAPAVFRVVTQNPVLHNPEDKCKSAYVSLWTVFETFNITLMLWCGVVLPLPLALAARTHCDKSSIGVVLAYCGFALAVPDLIGRTGECMPEGGIGLALGVCVAIILTIGMAFEILHCETNRANANEEKLSDLFGTIRHVHKHGTHSSNVYVIWSLTRSCFIPLIGLSFWAILPDRHVTVWHPVANGIGILVILLGSLVFHKCSAHIHGASRESREEAQIRFEKLLERLRMIPDGQESTLRLDRKLRLAQTLLRGVSLFSVLDSMTDPKDRWRKWLPAWAGGRRQMLDALTKAFALNNNDSILEDMSDGALSRANLYSEDAVPLANIEGFVSYNWDTNPPESRQRARQLEEVLTDAVGDIGRHACMTLPLWVDKFSSPQTGIAFEQARRFGFFFTEYLALCPRAFVLLSPQYFLRLWCRYEYVTFLAMHDPRNMYIGIGHFLECGAKWEEYETSIREGSVANSRCKDPADKATLHKLIDSNYRSHQQLDRLVQFSAIALTARALLVQYSPVCNAAFASILKLAESLKFEDLADDLQKIKDVLDKARRLATFCGCGRPPRTLLNGLMHRLFDERVEPTLQRLQEEALLEGSPLRKLAEEFGRLSSADNLDSTIFKSGATAFLGTQSQPTESFVGSSASSPPPPEVAEADAETP